MHLLPRHDADGMALTWPAKNPPRETLVEYAAAIRREFA
jgi:histidine triad (HIT) family protein